jgi:hypothetical protein
MKEKLFLTLSLLSLFQFCFSSELLLLPCDIFRYIFLNSDFYPEKNEFFKHLLKTRLLFRAFQRESQNNELSLYAYNYSFLGKQLQNELICLYKKKFMCYATAVISDIVVSRDTPNMVITALAETIKTKEYALRFLTEIINQMSVVPIDTYNNAFEKKGSPIRLEYEMEKELFSLSWPGTTTNKKEIFRCVLLNLIHSPYDKSFEKIDVPVDALLIIPGIHSYDFYVGCRSSEKKAQNLIDICGILNKKHAFFRTISYVMISGDFGLSFEYFFTPDPRHSALKKLLEQFNTGYVVQMSGDVGIILTSPLFKEFIKENNIFDPKCIVENPYERSYSDEMHQRCFL